MTKFRGATFLSSQAIHSRCQRKPARYAAAVVLLAPRLLSCGMRSRPPPTTPPPEIAPGPKRRRKKRPALALSAQWNSAPRAKRASPPAMEDARNTAPSDSRKEETKDEEAGRCSWDCRDRTSIPSPSPVRVRRRRRHSPRAIEKPCPGSFVMGCLGRVHARWDSCHLLPSSTQRCEMPWIGSRRRTAGELAASEERAAARRQQTLHQRRLGSSKARRPQRKPLAMSGVRAAAFSGECRCAETGCWRLVRP